MTRANLNFVYQNWGESPRTLFHYHNGDQYPVGLREHFNVLSLVKETITPERFKTWIEKEYQAIAEDLGEGGQPKVYYTDGYITDYSYVFELEEVIAWNWAECVFKGSREEFTQWIKKQ